MNGSRRRLAWAALAFTVLVLVLPELLPADPSTIDLSAANGGVSAQHPFGTDVKGRDQLTRVAYGARLSFLIGVTATAVSLVVGVMYGAVAGYVGGRLDGFMMRTVDVLYGLPFMLLVIILLTVLGQSVLLLFVALGLVQWLTMARVVRAEVLTLKEREFVQAARAIGMKKRRIIVRHLLPNVAGTVFVYSAFTVPAVILEEAFLSFLGLGVPAPMASLGTLIKDGLPTIGVFPWQLLFPSLALLALVFGTNQLGWRLKRLTGND